MSTILREYPWLGNGWLVIFWRDSGRLLRRMYDQNAKIASSNALADDEGGTVLLFSRQSALLIPFTTWS